MWARIVHKVCLVHFEVTTTAVTLLMTVVHAVLVVVVVKSDIVGLEQGMIIRVASVVAR